MPEHLKDKFSAEKNDLTPEVLKNLAWLGVDTLVPIGGDDTLSYGVRLHQGGIQSGGDSQDHGQRCAGNGLLHRVQHLRYADAAAGE